MEDIKSKVVSCLSKFESPRKHLNYGTAGFRDKFNLPLDGIFAKSGILASLRSKNKDSKFIGLMITASHNPEEDNGLKIVDYNGEMLESSWEPYAELLANSSIENFMDNFYKVVTESSIDLLKYSCIIVGRDCRPHSEHLSDCVRQGAESLGCRVFDLGEITTPQLHFVVNKINQENEYSIYESPNDFLDIYFSCLLKGYSNFLKNCSLSDPHPKVEVIVDASNGVGSLALNKFKSSNVEVDSSKFELPLLVIDVRNQVGDGAVNENCGAEFVQKNQKCPKNIFEETDKGKILCSFDGDADRIVFHGFFPTPNGAYQWRLLDGDKMASLIALYFSNEIKKIKTDSVFSIGVVQTAYANGASTSFLKKNNIPVVFSKTGVKYQHKKALEFDVGIHFESNGHGTVLFSEKFRTFIRNFDSFSDSNEKLVIERIKACFDLINPAVGDAMSDMLLCIATIQYFNMSFSTWSEIYDDLPCQQSKLKVKDKNVFKCSEDESFLISPEKLQMDLNDCMKKIKSGRCFIRPSGTEDVVRIYSEASDIAGVEELTLFASKAILEISENK